MNTAMTEQPTKVSLVARVAARYGVDPEKMLSTLKATAFRQANNADITNEQMMALLTVADKYSLDPFIKQIYAFPDKGGIVPIVSLDGWAHIVNSHPDFDGVRFQFDKDEQAYTCIMFRRDRHHPIEVTEYMAECKRNTPPWGSHPRRMLRHKAFIQCARLAFGFAGIYDEDEAHRIIEKDITPAADASRLETVRGALAAKPVADEVPPTVVVETPGTPDDFPFELTDTASTVEAGTSSHD